MSQTGRHLVTDFGISTVTGTTLGQTSSVGFTAGYVAPEILTDQSAGPPSDVYAIGATLFHMLAGRAPFVDPGDHTNLMALGRRVINDPVPDLRPEGIPDEVCAVIEAAMAKRPEDRPTAAELRDRLLEVSGPDAVQTGDLPATVPSTTVSSPAPPQRPTDAASPPSGPGPAPVAASTAASTVATAAAAALASAPAAAAATAMTTSTAPDPAMAPARFAPPGPAPAPEPATGPATSLWTDNPTPTCGVLEDTPSTYPSPGGAGPPGPTFVHIDDEPSMIVPLLIAAAVGLLLLVGVGGYLISRSGGDDGDGRLNIESVEGPTTSVDRSGNESTGQGVGGGRGTLKPRVSVTTGDATTETTGGTGTTRGSVVNNVVVPTLVGKTRGEAERTLAGLGLLTAAEVSRAFHPSLPSGAVIGSTPTAGSTVAARSTVLLVLSDGPAPPQCSDVIGLTEAQARATLEGGGLAVTSAPRSSDTVEVGRVVSCDRSESSAALSVSSGTDVCAEVVGADRASAGTLLESRGYSVTETGTPSATAEAGQVLACRTSGSTAIIEFATTPLPDRCAATEGRSEADARAVLADLGFTDIEVASQPSDNVAAGNVISCSVSQSTATLVVSTGPADTIVPDVVGLRRAAGNKQLRNAGLRPGGVEEVTSPEPAGDIIATRPAVGSAVRPDTEVVLIISTGTADTVEVPRVVGLPRQAATLAVNAAGLSAVYDTKQYPAGNDNIGTVVALDPEPGTEVQVGSRVILTIGVARQDEG